jgi:FtsH-binding integral membrane protein
MGLMLGPFVARFSYAAVTKAALITLVVTLVISVAGALYPQSVSHWGGFLFTGLIVTIVASFGGIILSAFGIVGHVFFRALDWIVIFLFCGYIFYDMNMAMREEKTFLQAIQSAAAMFLNILNIFVRILDIAGDD